MTSIWGGGDICEKKMSHIFEEEDFWRKLVQEIGGEEIFTERKYSREKYIWGGNIYGNFICKGNTQNEKILLERKKILIGIFFMKIYSRRELTVNRKKMPKESKIERNVLCLDKTKMC